MADLAHRLRTRLVPALLTAIGVMLLAGGLFSLTSQATADGFPSSSPTDEVPATETPEASFPTVTRSPRPLFTLPPLGSVGAPSPSVSIPVDRVATRIRIAALKIDLPVIRPTDGYPQCNVAMYLEDDRLGQPGESRATYIYAHARTGMFLPLLTASKVSNGKKMVGMVIDVWTSDDQRFLYVVTRVRRHVPFDEAVGDAIAAESGQLWLQTSEGVGTQPKLQIVAEPLSQEPADEAEAHPTAKPVNCR